MISFPLVFIVGTPGVGKTLLSKKLLELIENCRYISFSSIARSLGVAKPDPTGRLTSIVDYEGIAQIARELLNIISESCILFETISPKELLENQMIDENTALIILVRARPDIVLDRLLNKGWPWKKAAENALAEAFGIVAEELFDYSHSIVEVDTSGKTPDEAVVDAIRRIELWDTGIRIDWLSDSRISEFVSRISSRLDLDEYRLGI